MLTESRQSRSITFWKKNTPDHWRDWKWQIANRLINRSQLNQVMSLTYTEKQTLVDPNGLFRLGITPHYVRLIDPDYSSCPMRLQSVRRTHTSDGARQPKQYCDEIRQLAVHAAPLASSETPGVDILIGKDGNAYL